MKRGPSCGEFRSLEEWSKHRSKKDGLQAHCNPCRRTHRIKTRVNRARSDRQYREANRARIDARITRWKDAHRDHVNARQRQYYREHVPEHLQRGRRWRALHPERDRAYARAGSRRRRIKVLEITARRRARLRAATVERVDYARVIARDGGMCHLCHHPVLKTERSFDHLVPISKGGAHAEWNVALAHLACNLRKSDRFITPAQPPLF